MKKTKFLRKEFLNAPRGITLIALIITIIVMLILAGVTLSLVGPNGMINKAIQAKEETQISNYKEQIELIKTDLQMQNEDYKLPTIAQLKEEFDTNHKKWVSSTEIITDQMDNDIEKLKLTTKEGYIFYITETTTEYKGKGEVVDTSDLEKDDAIGMEIVGAGENGKKVQITDLTGKDYYKIKYKIGETGKWTDIKSGNQVEVAYGETIIAKLIYGSNEGQEHRLKVAHTKPTVTVCDDDLTNTVRKTKKAFSEIFKVTWGSEGTGKVYYKVEGNLKFDDTEKVLYETNSITDISQLELGTYKIYCFVATPEEVKNNVSNYKGEWNKEVKITALASTSVTNASNSTVSAKAIYSAYDLAYFRDLVNEGKEAQMKMNAKIMNDIDLNSVCSKSKGSWVPIGSYKTSSGVSFEEVNIYYAGIFDGNNKTIENIYINNTSLYRQGLIGTIYENGIVKNVTITGNIDAYNTSGGICGFIYNGKVLNCTNNVNVNGNEQIGGICGRLVGGTISNCTSDATIKGVGKLVGGIAGRSAYEDEIQSVIIEKSVVEGQIEGVYNVGGISGENAGTIQECYNHATVSSTGGSPGADEGDVENMSALTGGIVGRNTGAVSKCINKNTVTAVRRVSGGIAGRNLGTVRDCKNSGNVIGDRVVGGIVGNNRGSILFVYNTAEEIKGTDAVGGDVGGIIGNQNTNSNASTKFGYSKSKIIGNVNIGGVAGWIGIGTIERLCNIETETVVPVYGGGYSTDAVKDLSTTDASTMMRWDESTIFDKIGDFVKKENSLPILNITVNNITF